MPLLKQFKVLAVMLSFAVVSVYADAPKSGKVRLVIGDVQFQKRGAGSWNHLRVNGKVQEKDKIKTYEESTVSIALPDGSIVSIAELSEVEFSQLLMVDGEQVSAIEVREGQIRFDVQKQKGENSSFKIKTGTATCSIRGTDGTVGVTKGGQAIGSLNSGSMDMEQDGKKVSVKPQQFVAFRKGKDPIVGEAKNAGDPEFVKQIGEAVDDTTKSDADIVATAKTLDTKMEQKKEDLRSKYKCKFDKLPEVVDTNTVTIRAACSAGLSVTIGAETIKSEGSPIRFHPEWTPGALGEKKFVAMCSAEGSSFECGRLNTTYKVNRTVAFGDVDNHACKVNYTLRGFEDNKGTLKFFMDDSLVQTLTPDRDGSYVMKLFPGAHSYKLVAQNDDPAVGVIWNRFGCFPPTQVVVDFKGGTKVDIRKRVSQGSAAYPEVVFAVKNVPGDDPSQIESVKVRVDGKIYETKYVPVEAGIGYSSTVRLSRGKATNVEVIVTMKNGLIIRAFKTYTFR